MAKKTDQNDLSLLTKLYRREIHGSDQCHRKARPQRLFKKIPKRLCYRLSSLVAQSVLEEGHVFLGFTKCGQFVMSYTLQMDADESTGLPFYMYKLQWWWFVPGKPLQKVSEVRLFGEQEILQDLYVLFCEWPGDRSQVLVFGQSLTGRDQESCQCYFTVTAVPPLAPCKACDITSRPGDKSLCLKHSFCFHSKYELTPPFPRFCARVQLKCDGKVILNTGDSIVALHIDLDEIDSKPRGPFSDNASILKIKESSVSDKNSKDNMCCSPEPSKEFVWNNGVPTVPYMSENPYNDNQCSSGVKSPEASVMQCSDSESQKENTTAYVQDLRFDRLDRTKSPRSPKNILSQNQKSPTHPVSPAEKWFDCRNLTFPTSPQNSTTNQTSSRRIRAGCSTSDNHAQKDLYNFDSDDSEDNNYSFMCPNVPKASKSKSSINVQDNSIIPHPPQNLVISANVHIQRQIAFGLSRSSPLINNSQALNCNTGADSPRTFEYILAAKAHPVLQRSFFSPSNSENSFGGTSSSAESVIVQMNDARTVTHSWRKFSYHGDSQVDSTLVIEDDFDLTYRSVLPAEIRGTKNRQLSLSLDPSNDGNKEQICVKQLTFDIEHYMEEAIRGSAKWEDRYVAFTNYDLQILDVNPDSNEVVAKVFALISAREDTGYRRNRKIKGPEKLYQTSFVFEVNIQSGAYETLFIEDLKLIDERNLRSSDWKPGSRECAMLRRQTFIPHPPRSVHVLSNESVIQGKSLQMILLPEQFTAIIL